MNKKPQLKPIVYKALMETMCFPLLVQGIKLKVYGIENIPKTGSLIVASNHEDIIDPFVIAKCISTETNRYVQFMAKKQLFTPQIMGQIMSMGGAFPVEREKTDISSTKTALEILKSGGTLGIFPEGSRYKKDLQSGTAFFAIKTNSPILPVGIKRNKKSWIVKIGVPIQANRSIKETTKELEKAIKALSQ